MPVDPRTKRNIPAGRQTAQLLRRLWRRQEQEILAGLSSGHLPDLQRWNLLLADLARPLFLSTLGAAADDTLRRIRRQLVARSRKKDVGVGVLMRGPQSSALEIGDSFDLFNQHVLTAVQQAVLEFAASTNALTTQSVADARESVRELLAQGYSEGDTQRELRNKIRRIFADTYRAERIARTESSRAVHLGQTLAAQETGIVKGLRWLASSSACPLCEKIDGKVVEIGGIFYVNPKGGPYAVVRHPPAHPNCLCTIIEVIDWGAVSGKYIAA